MAKWMYFGLLIVLESSNFVFLCYTLGNSYMYIVKVAFKLKKASNKYYSCFAIVHIQFKKATKLLGGFVHSIFDRWCNSHVKC